MRTTLTFASCVFILNAGMANSGGAAVSRPNCSLGCGIWCWWLRRHHRRVVAQKLSERWGQQVIVDNRAGAAGVIGMQAAAKAQRDGYTLMIGSATQFSVGPALGAGQSQYPPLSSFTPIAKLVVAPIVLTVHPSLPVRSFKEFMQYAKSRSGQISYASTGVGTPNDIAMTLIARSGGFDIVHVPYKGGSEVLVAAVGGQVPIALGSLATAMPHIKSGKLRALGRDRGKAIVQCTEFADNRGVRSAGLRGVAVVRYLCSGRHPAGHHRQGRCRLEFDPCIAGRQGTPGRPRT